MINRHSTKNKSRWKRKDRILFLERLESYVSAGLPLDKALEITGEGISPQQKISVQQICTQVLAGIPLSRSLSTHIGISDTVAGLIGHGESSGGIAPALLAAKSLLEREDELSKKCLSAMAYPAVIGLFSIMLTIGLVRGVMPQIAPMLKGMSVELPLLTRIVIHFSDGLVLYGFYLLGGCIAGILIFTTSYRKVTSFRRLCQNICIRLPLIGGLIYSYALSLFLRSCGMLVESGAPVAESYRATSATISLLPLSRLLATKNTHVSSGLALGSVLSGMSKHIPFYVSPLLLAGEASGTLGASLVRAATLIDRDMEHSLKRLTSLIEPVMMAGMGLAVGAIALSIMMPIYDISKVLQK